MTVTAMNFARQAREAMWRRVASYVRSSHLLLCRFRNARIVCHTKLSTLHA